MSQPRRTCTAVPAPRSTSSHLSPASSPASSSEDWTADPKLAEIARALVKGIKEDLTVDWADHEATEAAIRAKVKRLLRRYGYKPDGSGGGRFDRTVELVLDQARTLYRMWPETFPIELSF